MKDLAKLHDTNDNNKACLHMEPGRFTISTDSASVGRGLATYQDSKRCRTTAFYDVEAIVSFPLLTKMLLKGPEEVKISLGPVVEVQYALSGGTFTGCLAAIEP
jgi:hypothetical protein